MGHVQAPHVIRTVGSLISKIPEHKIHVIAPDIGGGFGNKVGAYPGYICAIVASIVTGRSGEMGRGSHRESFDDCISRATSTWRRKSRPRRTAR